MPMIFDALADRLAQRAAETAQTAAIGLGAGLCLLVGSIFLASAAWLFLLTVTTALVACMVLGTGFFGIGLLMVAATSIRARNLKRLREAELLRLQAQQRTPALGGVEGIATLVVALINGFNAGKNARL